jgi:hypothetical protein
LPGALITLVGAMRSTPSTIGAMLPAGCVGPGADLQRLHAGVVDDLGQRQVVGVAAGTELRHRAAHLHRLAEAARGQQRRCPIR